MPSPCAPPVAAAPRGRRRADFTHYCRYDCERNGRYSRAICGQWIPHHEHDNHPTCWECLRAREQLEANEP